MYNNEKNVPLCHMLIIIPFYNYLLASINLLEAVDECSQLYEF